MADRADEDWGPEWHRAQQASTWARATPARRFAWLEEMLDLLRRREREKREQQVPAGDRDQQDR